MVKAGPARCTFHRGSIPTADEEPAADAEDSAPTRTRGAEDPLDALPCEGGCGRWFSIAHRLPGERMACPFCQKKHTVPTLITPAMP